MSNDALKLSPEQHAELARRLHGAIRAGVGIDPPSETTDYTFADAYQVRRRLVDLLIADGGKAVGHKIGFTSPAMQKMYGMTGPDFGQLLDDMVVDAGQPVHVSNRCDTRVEPEVAFVMERALEGPGVTIDDALDATRCVRAAVEVIDSRVGAMRAAANDSVADNAGAGFVVLGAIEMDPRSLDLETLQVDIDVDGTKLTGLGRDVMGHPAAPLAWLANKLAEIDGLGGQIAAGDIVITGSSTKSLPVMPGSHLEASLGPLGQIVIDFT